MATDSKIEWTHHTFNPWWGCVKISPACKHCYAETWAKRVGSDVWGSRADRRFFTDNHWKQPERWNREAEKAGERRRVFCASMADVFERRAELNEPRKRLWPIIESTPWLDWLLLTKRPQNIGKMAPWKSEWPSNIWLGTTVENQKYAEKRIPLLTEHDASVHFLSCEPLLGPINLSTWIDDLEWVIAGGESGHYSRPMNPDWARNLRDQCEATDTAFHFKQWGHWAPDELIHKGKRVTIEDHEMVACGKKKAGRFLDGRVHDGFPLAS